MAGVRDRRDSRAGPREGPFPRGQRASSARRRFRQIEPVLKGRGIDATYTEDVKDLNPANLKAYDALLVYANIDELAPAEAEALLDYVTNGGGFVPLHCALFCFRNAPEIVALTGAQFDHHGTGIVHEEVAERDHPVMKEYTGFFELGRDVHAPQA